MMESKNVRETIPLEIAIQLCAEIREDSERDWQTPAARWCWACRESSGGDRAQRGFLRQPGNRGCILVNARYAQMKQAI